MLGRRAFLAIIAFIAPAVRARLTAQAFPLDDFMALSSHLTGFSNLNRDTGDTILKNLLATPNGAARLALPDAALERDIIVAWYTGVQDVRGQSRVVTYTDALQWRALNQPAPGICGG